MLRFSQDRRDVACLGLMVMVYGLVLGPVLHAAVDHAGGQELPDAVQAWAGHAESTHAHSPAPHDEEPGHSHRHGKGRPHRHAWGSVEHLQTVALSHAVLQGPWVEWVLLRAGAAPRPEWTPVAPLRPTAMPQAP